MARFHFNGIDALEIDLERMANLDEETRWAMLEAGAAVFKRVFQEYLNKYHRKTGQLAESITITRFESQKSVRVWPIGKYHKKGRRSLRQLHDGSGASKRSKHHGAVGGSSMTDVAYYLEYGTPRMPATHWMENAIELANDEANEAMQEVWNKHLDDLGL